MRDSNTTSTIRQTDMQIRRGTIIKVLRQLLDAIDSEDIIMTRKDKQLVEDVLLYGTQTQVAKEYGRVFSSIYYRLDSALNKMARIQNVIRDNQRLQTRVAELEDKIREMNIQLDKPKMEIARLNDRIEQMVHIKPSPYSDNIEDNLNLKIEEIVGTPRVIQRLKRQHIETIRDVVKLTPKEFETIFGYTKFGIKLASEIKIMGLEVGMELPKQKGS